MTLQTFFDENNRVALAFSGGVDSAYLLYAAIHFGAGVRAYYVKSEFQPEFELEDARKLAELLNADLKVLKLNVLQEEKIRNNPEDRCYYCKRAIFGRIMEEAVRDGFPLLLDGTNASDDFADRPGMRVLQELKVRSPLRECGLTKQQIRELSKEAGLFTWNKPAYACLATRIPAKTAITKEMLQRVEQAEMQLSALGFADFRVRILDAHTARLQVREEQLSLVMEKRTEIVSSLKEYFTTILLDLEMRR